MSKSTTPPPQHRSRRRKARDYRAEYARRKEKGLAAGKSLPQARGHARAGERPKQLGWVLADPKSPEERGVRLIFRGGTISAIAREVGVSEQRLRRYLKENTSARWTGRAWEVNDARARQMPLYSKGTLVSPWLPPPEASRAGVYMHAIRPFLRTGDETLLNPFRREGVRDVNGRLHPFETDEDTLYELDNAGELSFPEFYKIVA